MTVLIDGYRMYYVNIHLTAHTELRLCRANEPLYLLSYGAHWTSTAFLFRELPLNSPIFLFYPPTDTLKSFLLH